MHRNIQKFALKVFQEFSSWVSRYDAVRIFFSDTKQKRVGWKTCKLRKTLVVFREHVTFNAK